MEILKWVGAVLFVGCGIAGLVMPHWLVRYRTDLAPGESPFAGNSMFPVHNYMNPANYTEQGRNQLKWLYLLVLLEILGAGALVIGWVSGGAG